MNNNWKQIGLALLGGILIGFCIGACFSRGRFGERWRHEKRYDRMLNRLTSKLKLSPEQKTQVAAIFEAGRKKMETLRADVRSKFDEIRGETNVEIRKVLTAEQQPIFDRMRAEWEARWKKQRTR